MSDEEFRYTVEKMRQSQKRYFRTRKMDDMRTAKEYEKLVDRELEERTGQLTFVPTIFQPSDN